MPPEPHPDTFSRPRTPSDADSPPLGSTAAAGGSLPLGSGLFDDDFDDGAQAKTRPGLKWIVASGLVILLGAGGWLGYRTWQRRSVDPVVVATETPSRDTLENRVDASGTMSLGNQQTLKAPGDVTVEAVLVEERQRVERGTVLLRLRDRGLEQQLDDAQIQTEILRLQRQR